MSPIAFCHPPRLNVVFGLRSLYASAVERHGRDACDVHAIEATNIDGYHFAAAWALPTRKGSHAALPAKQVMDNLFIELIIDELIRARAQRELLRRNEGPQRPAFRADRAVAGDDP